MCATEASRLLYSYFVVLFLASFGFNWLWEMAQMLAYVEMVGRSWWDTLPLCTAAALGDVAITHAIYGVGTLAAAHVRWGMPGKWNVYATGALLGGALAVVIEWGALASGRWPYTDSMPLVPVVECRGLWPFLQLVLLVPSALGIAAWWSKQR